MHKLAKGLKKKKKQKKGKKGAEEDEFDPEELERYRKERAEAQQKAAESGDPDAAAAAGSDEWKKFEALTAGVDSILKKTQGDLDRIKSTSFFQRKAPLEEKKSDEDNGAGSKKAKRWVGFDKDGNPVEEVPEEGACANKKAGEERSIISEDGFVDVPDDEDEHEDSAEEDIFDTTYVDVLQNIDVQLAYIPESPTEVEAGDDPFDTTSADKVLKTVDKKGNKLVSLGNAVEVLSGRIDHVSTCKISRPRKVQNQDLLLGDFDEAQQQEVPAANVTAEPVKIEKTLLDDDCDLPDIPIDLTKLPSVVPRPVTPEVNGSTPDNGPLDISEFEVIKEKTILEEIPDLDDAEFDLSAASGEPICIEEAEDPFGSKELEAVDFQTDIIEASFEAATFVDEEDPFDTTFADNILPGKTELKFIEKELEELPVAEVSISLTDPAGLIRDYETGLVTSVNEKDQENTESGLNSAKKDLLGGSVTDLSQLTDLPIAPVEEIIYVDPFDTSAVQELPPGKTELKFLEKQLLGQEETVQDTLSDDDFDPRKDEAPAPVKSAPPPRPQSPTTVSKPSFQVNFDAEEDKDGVEELGESLERKASRPEVLGLGPTKVVAFDLPTPSQRPDLLKTSEEEKAIPSKPLTPYYSQKSLEETLPEAEVEEADIDPFDTSFVAKVAPGKTELKLIESELLKQEQQLSHSLSDHDFNPRAEVDQGRRFSDFSATSTRPKSLKIVGLPASLTEENDQQVVVESNKRFEAKRQESLLDAEFEVDAKPLTPRIESRLEEEEPEISYADPFDTSIATNILPGKAELKLLENELSQIPAQVPVKPVIFSTSVIEEEEDDFDPRAEEKKESTDFLSLVDQDSGAKVLTPLQNKEFLVEEDIDPFDTSFAAIGPGKTELKLLESELIQH